MSFGRYSETVLASAARTAAVTTVLDVPKGAKGCYLLLYWTAETDTVTLTLNIDGRDDFAAETWTLLDSAALTAIGFTFYLIHPDAVAAANLVAKVSLPERLSITMAVGDADSATYSLRIIWLP